MAYFAIVVQYNGTNLHGWQRQVHVPTIQGLLEAAVSQVADHPVTLRVAGRTDAGVHATGQVAAFHTKAHRQPDQWLRGINALTPDCIEVLKVVAVDEDFHPRYSALARRYIYVLNDASLQDPFLGSLVWMTNQLDADAMHRQAQALLGEHDYTSFRAAGCQSTTAMRRINRCEVRRMGAYVVIDIEANAFLLHMVRNITSALHAIGAIDTDNPQSPTDTDSGELGQPKALPIDTLLMARDRSLAAPTAPAQGLYLVNVRYPNHDFGKIRWPSILQAATFPGS